MRNRLLGILVLAVILALVSTLAGCGDDDPVADDPPPATTAVGPGDAAIDEDEVLAMLHRMTTEYSSSRYANALEGLTDRAVRDCGGRDVVIDGMTTLQEDRGIQYRAEAVRARTDGSRNGLVTLGRNVGGGWESTVVELGPFVQENDLWMLDDVFPPGLREFCE
jgi:predicted small lipoprotein YifL